MRHHALVTPLKAIRMLLDGSGVLARAERWEEIEEAMARCFCECHSYPGTYPPPCGVCGHDTREGRMVGGYRDGWEPNPTSCAKGLEFRDGVTCSPFGTADICQNHRVIAGLRQHAVDADRFELENREYRSLLECTQFALEWLVMYHVIEDGGADWKSRIDGSAFFACDCAESGGYMDYSVNAYEHTERCASGFEDSLPALHDQIKAALERRRPPSAGEGAEG